DLGRAAHDAGGYPKRAAVAEGTDHGGPLDAGGYKTDFGTVAAASPHCPNAGLRVELICRPFLVRKL
ncbi:MAG: hypothetical protein ABIF82_12680, partial [Planctomycetota bacterium]